MKSTDNDMIISPSKLKGLVKIPPSKSISHRGIICAALAKGNSIISNLQLSDDIIATLDAICELGANYNIIAKDSKHSTIDVEITPTSKDLHGKITIDSKESGSTLRFLIPVAMALHNDLEFIGGGRLPHRPLDVYFDIFNKNNIEYNQGVDYLPLTIKDYLQSGSYNMRGDISSQFISGMLLALAVLGGKSIINITSNLESRNYIDLTLDVMKMFGINVCEKVDRLQYIIEEGLEYVGGNYYVEGDWSQAAFFLLAGINSQNIKISGLNKMSKQGDMAIVDILNSMGANIYWQDDILISKRAQLHAKTVDVSQCPDLAPIIAGAMAIAQGKSRIIGGQRLKIKESDRILSTSKALNAIGADVTPTDDGMIINGKDSLYGGIIEACNDHRIAMLAGAMAGFCGNDIRLVEPYCVNKSYPGFWQDFKSLGGITNE